MGFTSSLTIVFNYTNQ